MFEQLRPFLKNDIENFRDIFNEFYNPLYNLSLHYLKESDEAKEVVQEAFMKLWEIKHELSANSNIRNFLYTLVKNNCLNVLKRREILLKHHEKIKRLEIHYQYESLIRNGSDCLEINELKEKIELAIQNLPEYCRRIFEMSRFEELKNREIAEKMGISQKTVEAHLTKALKILRGNLREYLPIITVLTKILD